MNSIPENPAERRCPECTARLTDSAISGPCPACLMRLGMQSWRENQSLPGTGMAATLDGPVQTATGFTVEQLADKFPQFELMHLVGSGGIPNEQQQGVVVVGIPCRPSASIGERSENKKEAMVS